MAAYRTLQDVERVPLGERARVVRELCRATSDVDERFAFVAAAFLPDAGMRSSSSPVYTEDAGGQFVLDLEVAS